MSPALKFITSLSLIITACVYVCVLKYINTICLVHIMLSVYVYDLRVVTWYYMELFLGEDHFSYAQHFPVAHSSLSRVETPKAFPTPC